MYIVLSKARTAEPVQTTGKLRKLEFMSAPKGIWEDGLQGGNQGEIRPHRPGLRGEAHFHFCLNDTV